MAYYEKDAPSWLYNDPTSGSPSLLGADIGRNTRRATSIYNNGMEQGMARDAESVYNASKSALDDEWNAGVNDRLAENLKSSTIDMTGNRTFGDGTLSNTEAGIASTAIDAGANIASGIISASQTSKARKRAEREAKAQIAETRERNQQIYQREDEAFENEKNQARWGEIIKNTALRQDMMSRDIDKAIQRYKDQQSAIENFYRNSADNEAFKMAIADRM